MEFQIIDKWESIPSFVLNNEKMLFNGIYIPKGAYLNVYGADLISFGFRGSLNPKILLRSPQWHLYELEFQSRPYQQVIPGLHFASSQLKFNDTGEKHVSQKVSEGIVTGTPNNSVTITGFEVFSLTEAGKAMVGDEDERNEIEYEIDVDCAILTKFSHDRCAYFQFDAGAEGYQVLWGTETLVKERIYAKTQWFDFLLNTDDLKNWKSRNCP